jgi:hypothetical protein
VAIKAAGGMTFHTSRTFHFAGVNRTARMRRAWGTAFQSEPILRDEPAPHQWWHDGKAAHAARQPPLPDGKGPFGMLRL